MSFCETIACQDILGTKYVGKLIEVKDRFVYPVWRVVVAIVR